MTGLNLDTIECADVMDYLRGLPDACVNLVVTSPPYFGLRSYLQDGHEDKAREIGTEQTPAAYVARMVDVFREVKRVIRDDASVYVNLGDSYSDKQLLGIPWRFVFAMQDAGWLFREEIIWQKPNPMPESVRDRCTRSHEYIFHFTKSPRYWYDAQAVSEPVTQSSIERAKYSFESAEKRRAGAAMIEHHDYMKADQLVPANGMRNRRSVWTINPANFREAHFATFPEDIPEICIKAACPEGGVVLDPFAGAGTVGLVAKKLNRRYIGCDLNADYVRMAEDRINGISYTLFSLMEVTSDE
jgi:DNA modification methylase